MNLSDRQLDEALRADPALAEAVEELTARLKAGEAVDLDAWLSERPAYAGELRRLLPMLRLLADLSCSGGASGPAIPPEEAVSGLLGDFRIVREVGKGGMGVVYEAEQVSLRRRVALKVLPFAATMDPRHLQRFHNEARAAASLHHEHIVPVHAVGCERGVHYYAMQFVEGQTLAALIAQQRRQVRAGAGPGQEPTTPYKPPAADPLAPTSAGMGSSTQSAPRQKGDFRRVAEWGIQAAEALDHAHRLGIVHRDIKPGNLMLDAAGKVWITDFGLARTQADASLTMTGDLLGTLRYMSPEQALAKRLVVDHRTDVYSLGATLYELLTLEPAVGGKDREELLRQIAFEEPRPPRRVNKAVPVELETIVLKAMEKNPRERYATAQDFADDLRRFLDEKPIHAKSPTLVQRTAKWGRRHQSLVAAGIVVLLIAVVCLVASTLLIAAAYDAETHARGQAQWAQAFAEREWDTAERRLYLAHIQLAKQAWEKAEIIRVQELLDEHIPKEGDPDRRGWEWNYLRTLCDRNMFTLPGMHRQSSVAWSPDGQRLVDDALKIRDANTGQEVLSLGDQETGGDRGSGVAWSPDGKWVATRLRHGIKIWGTSNWQKCFTLRGVIQGRYFSQRDENMWGFSQTNAPLAWSPDSKQLAWVSGDGGKTVTVWSIVAGQSVSLGGHKAGVVAVKWSPDSQRLLAECRDYSGKVWNVVTVKESFALSAYRGDWSRDGRWLASITTDKAGIKIWDGRSGKELLGLRGHKGRVTSLTWGPEERLASASMDGTLKVWHAITGHEIFTLRGHTEGVLSVDWAPAGEQLASASLDRTIKLWNARAGEATATLRGHRSAVVFIDWSPNSQQLLSIGAEPTVIVWDTTLRQENRSLEAHAGPVRALTWSPGGQRLASSTIDGTLKVWDVVTGKETLTLQPYDRLNGHSYRGLQVAWSPDGKRLASARQGPLKILDADTGGEVLTIPGEGEARIAWSPDGGRLASIRFFYETIDIWNTITGQKNLQLNDTRKGGFRALGLAWSPGGKELAASGRNDETKVWEIKVWDAITGQEIRTLRGHEGGVEIAWSPDGQRLASMASGDFTIAIWDMTTGQVVHKCRGHTKTLPGQFLMISSVTWAPDSQRLASACGEGAIKIWDANLGQELLTLSGDREWFGVVAWSADGQRLAAGSNQGTIKIWDTSKRATWPPAIAESNNNIAWFLATCPDLHSRNPNRAVELAKRAVQQQPDNAHYWNTLAVGYYRNGNWKSAIEALARSAELGQGGTSFDFFFLAMAHWQRGEKEQARQWYNKAVEWMKTKQPNDQEELRRFQAEAAKLLGIEGQRRPDEPKPPEK